MNFKFSFNPIFFWDSRRKQKNEAKPIKQLLS